MLPETVNLVVQETMVKRGEFRLTYELTNGTSSTIFLYNILPDRFALRGRRESQFPRTDLGQTSWLAPNTAVILLGPAPRPYEEGVHYFGFYRPLLSKIKAGKSFRGTIKARLPLVEWSDTCGPSERENLPRVDIKRLRLVAIYVREENAEEIERHPLLWTCYDLFAPSKHEHRVQVEQDISHLDLTLVTNPRLIRFE
jgi:hypothetical protein